MGMGESLEVLDISEFGAIIKPTWWGFEKSIYKEFRVENLRFRVKAMGKQIVTKTNIHLCPLFLL